MLACIGPTRSWTKATIGFSVASEMSVLADTALAVPRLAEICKRIACEYPSRKRSVEERTERAKTEHRRLSERWANEAKVQWDDVPISWPRLASESWEVVKNKKWVVAYAWLFREWLRRLWMLEEPGCYLGPSGAGGLGYGVPASIGASLGMLKEKKLVIDFQPDGDLLYTTSALWTAAHHNIPILIVMLNNKSYYNDAHLNKLMAQTRGRDVEAAMHVGGDIDDPPVDFKKLAESLGVHGMGPVEKPDDIKSTLEKAIQIVDSKRKTVLVDVITKPR